MVAERESGELAKRLVAETCLKQGIGKEQLTHACRSGLLDEIQMPSSDMAH
jgi:hypothetical protein